MRGPRKTRPATPASPSASTPRGSRGLRLLSPWHPRRVRAYLASAAYRVLADHTSSSEVARSLARSLAAAVTADYERAVAHAVGYSHGDELDWRRIAPALMGEDGTPRHAPGGHPADTATPGEHTEREERERGGESILDGPSVVSSLPRSEASPGIDRADVVGLLRDLLRRAGDGDLSPADAVRVADLAARLEGHLAARSAADVRVTLVLYDSDAYRRLVAGAPPSKVITR